MDKAQEINGWAGAGFTIISFFFPAYSYLNVIRGKLSYDNTPSFLVISSYINYFCLYVYGDMIFCDQVKYAYLIGSIINCVLMSIYLFYEIKKFFIDTILNILLIFTGTWALYRCLTIMIDDDRIVGKICILTFFIVYISPIQILYKVFKDKNYNLIPKYNCWVSFFSSIFWIIFSIYISDFYILFPNIINIVINLAQIIVYIHLSLKYPAIGKKEFSSTIGIESTSNEEDKKEDVQIKVNETTEVEIQEKPVKILTKN